MSESLGEGWWRRASARPGGHRILNLIVGAAFVKGLFLLFFIPPFQTPDEYGHYDYALYLAHSDLQTWLKGDTVRPERLVFDAYTTNETYFLAEASGTDRHLKEAAIPKPRPTFAEMWRRAAQPRAIDDPHALASKPVVNALFNYPPLYYLGIAWLHRVEEWVGLNPLAAFYSARLVSLICFTLALVLSVRILDRCGLAWETKSAVLLLMAFQPQLSLQSISVQPDNVSLLLVTWALLALCDFARGFSRSALTSLAVAAGLTLLVKTHFALPLLAAAGVAVVARAAVDARRRSALLGALGVTCVIVVAIGGWWYARSLLLYDNALGLVQRVNAPGASTPLNNLRTAVALLPFTFDSYWGRWGWLDYGYPTAWRPWLLALSMVPACFYLVWATLARRWRAWLVESINDPDVRAIGIIQLALVIFFVEMVLIVIFFGAINAQGRHWLIFALPESMYLVGWLGLLTNANLGELRSLIERRRAMLRLGAIGLTVVLSVSALAFIAELPNRGYFDVTLSVSEDSNAEVFFDSGLGYNEVESVELPVLRRDHVTTLTFPIHAPRIVGLRFDPLRGSGQVDLYSLRIRDAEGHVLANISPSRLVPIQGLTITETGTERLTLTSNSPDPIARIEVTPIEFEGGLVTDVIESVRQVFRRLYRRVPFTSWLPTLFPTILLIALSAFGVNRLMSKVDESSYAFARRAIVVALVLWLLVLHVYLCVETYRFYYLVRQT